MQRSTLIPVLTAIVIALPIVGYGIMRMSTEVVPMGENTVPSHFITTLVIIALGLTIPYWMLKLGFKRAQKSNYIEPDMKLTDLPESQRAAGKRDVLGRITPAQNSGNDNSPYAEKTTKQRH